MKKNKLLKTAALALGTVASVAAPIAAVVSCGGMDGKLSRYNTSEKDYLELDTTYSKTGPQYEALNNLVSAYNKSIAADYTAAKDAEAAAQAALDNNAKAIGAKNKAILSATGDDKTKLLTDLKKLTDATAALKTALETAKTNVKTEKTKFDNNTTGAKIVKVVHVEGGPGAIASQLKTKFISQTDAIPNMFIDYADAAGEIAFDKMSLDFSGNEGQLDKAVYGPMNEEIGRSTEKVTKDGKTTSKQKTLILPISQSAEMLSIDAPLLVHLVKAAGGTFSNDPADVHTKAIVAAANTSGDFAKDADKTLEWLGTNGSLNKSTFEVTDKDFASYESLFKLSDNLAKAQGLDQSDTRRILGLDAGANALYEIAYSQAGADKDKFIYTKDSDKDYVDYGLFEDQEKVAAFKGALTPIVNAINDGSTRIYGGGAYASSDETHHQLAMAIGSTAGYSHNFTNAGTTDKVKTISGHLVDGSDIFLNPSDATKVQFKSGSHTNNVVAGKGGQYDKVVSGDSFKAIVKFLTDNPIKDAVKGTLFIKGEDKPEWATAKNSLEVKSPSGKTMGWVALADGEANKAASTLQESELVTIPAPTSYKAADAKVAFLQGPGLIGVHNNAAEDKATKLFAHWLTSTQKLADGFEVTSHVNGNYNSPLAAWAAGSEYAVSASTGTLGAQTDLTGSAYVKGNYYVTKMLAGMKLTGDDKLNLLTPPADESSAYLRTQIQTLLKAGYDTYHGKGSAIASVDSIYSTLKTHAKINDLF